MADGLMACSIFCLLVWQVTFLQNALHENAFGCMVKTGPLLSQMEWTRADWEHMKGLQRPVLQGEQRLWDGAGKPQWAKREDLNILGPESSRPEPLFDGEKRRYSSLQILCLRFLEG